MLRASFALLLGLVVAAPGCDTISSWRSIDDADIESFGADKVKGSKTGVLIAEYEHDQMVSLMGSENAGVKVNVKEVRNDLSGKAVECYVEIMNRYDDELRLPVADVRFNYKGADYAGKPKIWDLWKGEMATVLNIPPKSMKRQGWRFEIGTEAEPGTYDVSLTHAELWRDGLKPVPDNLKFGLKVVGIKKGAASGE